MNIVIMVFLCIMAWALTLSRIRAIQWKDISKDNGIALHVWLMMVFFSITLTFLIKEFSNFFDAHTFNNLDRLISYCSILIGMYFGAAALVDAIGNSVDKRTIRWLQYALVLTILTLALFYIFFISRIPNMEYYVPRSLPEVSFLLVTFSVGAALCVFVVKVNLVYLPFEESPVMRLRTILIIVSTFSACAFFLTKILTAGGYFWPGLTSQALINLSTVLLVFSALAHFSALLSNRLYVSLVMISRNIQGWMTLNDLKYLMEQLQQLCPEIALPVTNPSFVNFLLNPEYYLYRAIITIMDGKTMLDDLLLEGALQGEPALWEGEMLREAVRVKQVMQSIDPPEDFWKLVSEYRRASNKLIQGQNIGLSQEASPQ